jgi:hypothetical protein
MGNYNIITNNTFTENINAIYFVDEVSDGSNYNYVANNTCTDTRGYLQSGQEEWQRTDGHCVGIQNGEYNIVENNTSTDGHNGAFNAFASSSSYPIAYNVYRNNISIRSNGAGMNYASDNDRDGETASKLNFMYGNVIVEPNADDARTRAGILVSSMRPTEGNRFFNNTIYKGHTQGLEARYGSDYAYFVNNIVTVDGRTASSDMLFRFQGSTYNMGSNFTIEKNLYWTSLGDPSSYNLWNDDQDSGVENWAAWTTKWDTTSPSPADPLFEDAANNDFTLAQNSPAIDAGRYLTYVTESVSSVKTVEVADNRWFHGDFGLVDEDGNDVTGMAITLYDTTNGLQQVFIDQTTITYATPGDITVNENISTIYNVSHLSDPAYTTQVALTFYGTAPDIGAEEYTTGGGGAQYAIEGVTFSGASINFSP